MDIRKPNPECVMCHGKHIFNHLVIRCRDCYTDITKDEIKVLEISEKDSLKYKIIETPKRKLGKTSNAESKTISPTVKKVFKKIKEDTDVHTN